MPERRSIHTTRPTRRGRVALGVVLTSALAALTAGLGATTASAATDATASIDQASQVINGTGLYISNDGEYFVQSFTAGQSGALTAIDLYAYDYGSGPVDMPIAISIVGMSGGTATSEVYDSETADLTVDNGWNTIPLSTPPTVSAGTQYGIRMQATSGTDVQLIGASYSGGQVLWGGFDGYSSSIGFRTYVAPIAPTISGAPSATGIIGRQYSSSYTVTGAPAATLDVAGSLPPGLTLAQDGTVSGTPTATGTYSFTVTATNSAGTATADQATITVRDPIAPSTPTGIVADAAAGSVAVRWDAAAPGDDPITAYTVTAAPGGASCTTTDTSCTVVGLTPGTEYTFDVTATSIDGTSPVSAPSDAVTPYTIPGAPGSATATAGDASAEIDWTTPTDDGSSPITGYSLEATTDGDVWTSVGTVGPTESSATATGLENGAPIRFRVQATNAAGGSAWTSTTEVVPLGAPTAPSALTATAADRTVALSWQAPETDGGSPITGYLVEHRSAQAEEWTSDGTVTDLATNVSGLDRGTTYEFRVSATNTVGTGAASDSTLATTEDVPGAPVIGTATASDSSVALTWSAPDSDGGAPLDGYTVQSRIADGSWGDAETVGAGTTSVVLSGYTNGTAVSFRVVARNALGAGVASDDVTATPFGAPSAPVVTDVVPGDGSATISWTTPNDGGSAVTGSEVEYRIAGTTDWSDPIAVAGTASTTTITGLENGRSYEFRVRVQNAAGTSAWPTDVAASTSTPFVLRVTATTSDGTSLVGTTVHAGATIRVAASDLPVGALATVVVHSAPVTLGTARVAADGTLAFTGTLPSDLPGGAHAIVVTLTETGADPATDTVPFAVAASVAPLASTTMRPVATTARSTDSASALAFTGSTVPMWLVGMALAATLVGATARIVGRRRAS